MRLDYTLFIYFLLFIIMVGTLKYLGCEIFNTIIFTVVILFLFLLFFKPPSDVLIGNDNISCIGIYYFIILVTILMMILYTGFGSFLNLEAKKD